MIRNIITALDIGTSTVQAVIAERTKDEDRLRILGIGVANSFGIRRGAVVDIGDVITSIRKAIEEARRSSGIPVKSVWLSIGGSHVSVSSSKGVIAVSRADGEISPEDVKRVIAAAESFVAKNPNKEILHIIPRDFKVDSEGGIKDPVGMYGVRLEVDTLIIEYSIPFLKNLFKCVEGAGYKIEDYIFSPLAASHAVLTKRQKELGVMLVDIGGGTASFIIYEEGVPIHAGVVPIGGSHITNDVAIGFRTHVDVAERIKVAYASCMPEDLPKRDVIRLADFVSDKTLKDADSHKDYTATYSRKELAEIVEARMQDLFELLQKELKKIGRNELLPAGVVLVGGSSLIPGIIELTKREMKLPVERGLPGEFLHSIDEKIAPSFAVVFGVLQWTHAKLKESGGVWNVQTIMLGQSKWLKWLKSFLP